jgi:magnesium/cobalt transport protein CorA
MATAVLFERDDVSEIEDWSERLPKLGRRSILWIDLEQPSDDDIAKVAEQLELEQATVERLRNPQRGHASFGDFEHYLHVTAFAPCGDEDRTLARVSCLVGERWVVTVHDAPLAVLEKFRKRTTGSGEIGELDGLEFLATLLEWVLTAYLDAFEQIEIELEDIETGAMRRELDSEDDALEQLVAMRQEIGTLRRALVSHRETILALTRPELEAIASSRSAERFSELRARLEEAVQAARDSRDSVVGSFDVLIATTGQRTNEIMKVLTLASVLLLPGAVVAGIFGMNFRLAVFDDTAYFWVVLGGVLAFAALTLVAARMRHWI